MAAVIHVRPMSSRERVLYSSGTGSLIFSCLGYTDQDKAKRVSKRCLELIDRLQRNAILKEFPQAHLKLLGGKALAEVAIRNIPIPMPPPKPNRFPDLAVGWTRIRPEEAGGCITWRLHVYKQEMSADGTAKNMMVLYFTTPEEAAPPLNYPALRIGIWGVEAPSCSRIYPCSCLVCCPKKYAWWTWACFLNIAFCCGCTKILSVNDDSNIRRNVANINNPPIGLYTFGNQGIPYIPIWSSRRNPDEAQPSATHKREAGLSVNSEFSSTYYY